MKKVYKKPMLYMESFTVRQNLSACSHLIGFRGEDCVMNDADSTDSMKDLAMAGFFSAGACTLYPQNMDFDDGVCYHTAVNLAFSS